MNYCKVLFYLCLFNVLHGKQTRNLLNDLIIPTQTKPVVNKSHDLIQDVKVEPELLLDHPTQKRDLDVTIRPVLAPTIKPTKHDGVDDCPAELEDPAFCFNFLTNLTILVRALELLGCADAVRF